MMQKLIGCLLILAGCTGFGICKGQELQLQLRELEAVKQIFYLLRNEMNYTRAPFEEIFHKIGQKTDGKYGVWIRKLAKDLGNSRASTFEEIWVTSIEEGLKDSHLKLQELEELKKAGKSLGYVEGINLYIEQLEYEIKDMREVYQTKRKLCQSLGIAGGIFLVILLI